MPRLTWVASRHHPVDSKSIHHRQSHTLFCQKLCLLICILHNLIWSESFVSWDFLDRLDSSWYKATNGAVRPIFECSLTFVVIVAARLLRRNDGNANNQRNNSYCCPRSSEDFHSHGSLRNIIELIQIECWVGLIRRYRNRRSWGGGG